jgi:ATP-binding cassette subfamily B multidrug efflux pump
MISLKRMTAYVWPYRWVTLILVITVILPVAMELLVPRALSYVIDEGIAGRDMTAIFRGSAVMLATALVGALATLGQGICRAQLSQGLAYDMRNDLFAHIQTFSFANLDHMQTGQLMTRLSSDVDLVRMFVSNGLSLLLRALLMVVGSIVMMFIIDWHLALIMLILLPLAAIFIMSVMVIARPLYTIVQEKLSGLNTIVQENLAGVQVVKAFVRERFEITRFQAYNDDYMRENIKVGRLIAVATPLLMVLTNLGIVAVVWFGGADVINDHLSVGELVAFNSYLLIGMAPLLLLGNILTMASRSEASAQRVWELLDTEPFVQVSESPHRADEVQGRLNFSHVSFRYDGVTREDRDYLHLEGDAHSPLRGKGGRRVLHDISFSVEPGQRVALLGSTGSGKSTLVNLIPRFYDTTGGQITIDGVNVRDWEPEVLRAHIGMVLQQTVLFSGTVWENIAYGRPDATMEEVIAAAKAAQAHDFISALPLGYRSPVEERGANFSGGQKQRIAIARALLVSPGILVLDDSTSAVDIETEALIQKALDNVKDRCTTFIVAQRISSVLNANKIIVLEDGRIAAQGTHPQLLETSPIYREIYNSQLGDDHLERGLPA